MKKKEFVKAVADAVVTDKSNSEEKVSLEIAKAFVDAFCETVIETLQNGESVSLQGFGTFDVKKRNERTGRNPQTGEKLVIPAALTPHFKASSSFKNLVNA